MIAWRASIRALSLASNATWKHMSATILHKHMWIHILCMHLPQLARPLDLWETLRSFGNRGSTIRNLAFHRRRSNGCAGFVELQERQENLTCIQSKWSSFRLTNYFCSPDIHPSRLRKDALKEVSHPCPFFPRMKRITWAQLLYFIQSDVKALVSLLAALFLCIEFQAPIFDVLICLALTYRNSSIIPTEYEVTQQVVTTKLQDSKAGQITYP